MGLCGSGQKMSEAELEALKREKDRNRALEQNINQDLAADKQVNKLLLLGAGESGKSTLFKQMISIYGKGFPEQERMTYVPIIYNNIITAMKTLCKQSTTYGPVAHQNRQSAELVEVHLKGDEDIDPVLGQHIANLWADEGIQRTYANRAKFQLTDSSQYFFDKIKEVSTENYLPTQQDVLRSRVRTTGIVENDFEIDNNKFKMFDVGGQRKREKEMDSLF